jgi:mannitol/fructose-specific phosphotransferase system IIA component (Ntr-type)
MNIYSLIKTSTILADFEIDDKEGLLHKMVDVLKDQVNDEQLEDIRDAVFEREKIMSTGVGKSLAIPHGKVESIEKNYASFAVLKEPIDYDSIDDNPVNMAFLLVGPAGENRLHIKLLSRISRLMNSTSFRTTLSECKTPEEIYEAFHEEEVKYFGN